MSHPLSVTIGESKIIERAFSAGGVICTIYPDPDDAGRVVFERLSGRKGAMYPWLTLAVSEAGYTDRYGEFEHMSPPRDGVVALLQVLKWFHTTIFNGHVAAIVVAATRAALDAHTLIADADRREDSIDSGDAIDRCYDFVRVILPEYTTSADIEPPLSEGAVDK